MGQEVDNKQKPVLTIVAGILTIAHILVLIFSVVCFVTHAYSLGILSLAYTVGVGALVLTIVSKRNHIKKLWVPMLILNIITLAGNFFVSGAGLLQMGIGNAQEERDRNTQERAIRYSKVEIIKTILPSKNMCLSNDGYRYFYDVDGDVVNKFKSIEFTLVEDGVEPETAGHVFYGDNDCTVTFFEDYSGLSVESHCDGSGVTFGHIFYSYKNIYSLDQNDGQQLFDLIHHIIEEQTQAYDELENEIKSSLTLESAINSMDEEGVKLQCEYRKPNEFDSIDTFRKNDDEHLLLNALKDIDFTQVSLYEDQVASFRQGFEYKTLKQRGMLILLYNASDNTMKVTKYYEDMFEREQKVIVVYKISAEDGVSLMEVAEELTKVEEL